MAEREREGGGKEGDGERRGRWGKEGDGRGAKGGGEGREWRGERRERNITQLPRYTSRLLST